MGKITNRQLQGAISPPCSLTILALEYCVLSALSTASKGKQLEPLKKNKSSLAGPPSPFTFFEQKPLWTHQRYRPFLSDIWAHIYIISWNSAITFPFLEAFSQCAKALTSVQPPVRDVLMAELFEEQHNCNPAHSHNLLHGCPQLPVGSWGAFVEWKCSLNPAYLARRFAKKEPSAPSSCTDGLTHWTQDSHLDVSLKDGCKPRSSSILSLICCKDSFPHKNLLSFSHLREHLSLSKNSSSVNPVPCSF